MQPQRVHYPLLDPLRILASVSIVRHHMRGDALLGVGFGLPLFLVILFALSTLGTRRESLTGFARRKAAYLLGPWLRWSLFYVALAAAADTARGLGPAARLEPAMLLYGGHGSLWFLPFAACALPVARVALRAAERVPARAAALGLALAAVLATHGVAVALGHPLRDMPERAWLRFSPAILWGVALGRCLGAPSEGERRALLAAVGALAVLGCALSPLRVVPDDLLRRFAVAVPLAGLGFALRVRVPRAVHDLATLTFGVYLAHPLIGKVLGTCFEPLAWPAALHTALAWLGAAAVVLALRRAPLRLHECWVGNAPLRPVAAAEGPRPPELERVA